MNKMLENPLFGRGAKTRLAEFLGVQGSFISLVLSGKQEFSADHSIKIAEFLKLDETETGFFMTMVQRDRAGTPKLKRYYQQQLDRTIKEQSEIKVHVQGKEVETSEQDLSLYYGSWFHAAIHMAIHSAKHRTVAALVAYTQLKESQVRESIDLLVRLGFAQFDKDTVVPIDRNFHLGKRSLALRSHHTNWRNQAVRSLDDYHVDALHYSLVLNIDSETAMKIRELLLESFRKTHILIGKAKIENVYSLCVDLFQVFG
ncbi:MAG: TIGR02147 family protein [Bdellovibrionales bacterium]|nr:TIGR02147 family protein [Bdellovibrionales bacterium]